MYNYFYFFFIYNWGFEVCSNNFRKKRHSSCFVCLVNLKALDIHNRFDINSMSIQPQFHYYCPVSLNHDSLIFFIFHYLLLCHVPEIDITLGLELYH